MEKVLNFLNTNSGSIQAVLVLLLVSFTIWYAWSTEKMVILMSKQYKLTTKPYLYPAREIDRNFNKEDNTIIQLRYLFTNVGNVDIKYYIEEFSLEGVSINPPKSELILFPAQKGYLYSNLYHSKDDIKEGNGLSGRIKIIYWANDIPETKYYFQRSFTLAPNMVAFIISESVGLEK